MSPKRGSSGTTRIIDKEFALTDDEIISAQKLVCSNATNAADAKILLEALGIMPEPKPKQPGKSNGTQNYLRIKPAYVRRMSSTISS